MVRAGVGGGGPRTGLSQQRDLFGGRDRTRALSQGQGASEGAAATGRRADYHPHSGRQQDPSRATGKGCFPGATFRRIGGLTSTSRCSPTPPVSPLDFVGRGPSIICSWSSLALVACPKQPGKES